MLEAKMTLAPTLSAKTGIRQDSSQTSGASTTRNGRIGRLSKTRAPVQVSP